MLKMFFGSLHLISAFIFNLVIFILCWRNAGSYGLTELLLILFANIVYLIEVKCLSTYREELTQSLLHEERQKTTRRLRGL